MVCGLCISEKLRKQRTTGLQAVLVQIPGSRWARLRRPRSRTADLATGEGHTQEGGDDPESRGQSLGAPMEFLPRILDSRALASPEK